MPNTALFALLLQALCTKGVLTEIEPLMDIREFLAIAKMSQEDLRRHQAEMDKIWSGRVRPLLPKQLPPPTEAGARELAKQVLKDCPRAIPRKRRSSDPEHNKALPYVERSIDEILRRGRGSEKP